ncbi:MAG: hypothetical protein JW781_02655 [Deltaproteobacteria bacterium]|nr:hypothetical protein [Candidatus Anaeroferrophillacea bacterium]
MFRPFVIPLNIPGTLAADVTFRWTVPFDLTIKHVSAVASNDSDATLKVGNSSDDDAYLAACVIGDSAVPVEKARADFVGSQYPHLSDGTVLLLTLDHDGSGGTAAQNVSIVLTCEEG